MTEKDPNQPRCESCDTVLRSEGSICHACDSEGLFIAPIISSPPLDMQRHRFGTIAAKFRRRRRWLIDSPFEDVDASNRFNEGQG